MKKYDEKGLTEAEFLEQYKRKQYPKPSLTADILVFRQEQEKELSLLLIKRKNHPFLDFWALPGGFAKQDECLSKSAVRELSEETGITGLTLRLVGIYSKPGRDPRGWMVSAAYCVCIAADCSVRAGDDADACAWFRLIRQNGKILLHSADPEMTLTSDELAFDHGDMLSDALKLIDRRA